MAKSSSDIYGSMGSVPGVATQSSALPEVGWRATPEEFGAQIGKGLQNIGSTTQDLALKYQGIMNETAAVQADAAFAMKAGDINAKYKTLTGNAAYNAYPQYQQDMKAAFDEFRGPLPPAAQRAFDHSALRSMANHITDGSAHAASQLKEANRDAYSSSANADIQSLLDPNIAASKERSQFHLDSLKYSAQAQIDQDHPGLKTDPETGEVSFDESKPEGQALKADTEQKINNYLSQGYFTRYNTLSNLDVFSAHNEYQQERDQIPRNGQVAIDAMFGPKIFNAHVGNVTGTVLADAHKEQYDILTNPRSDSANSAIGWTMDHEGGFVPNDSGKGPTKYGINSESNPGVDIQNLTKEEAAKIMHDKYYLGVGADKMSHDMGAVALDTAVNMGVQKAKDLVAQAGDDPQKLIDLRRAEYQRLASTNPEHYGQYLEGWNKRLDDLQKTIGGEQPSKETKSYATNENGGPLSLADYYRTNSADVLRRGEDYAEKTMPGDLAFKGAVRTTLTNEMNKTIANESAQKQMDNRNIMRAISGEFTKGSAPQTEAELRAIPGMNNLLDKVAAQDPKFTETIPTMISKIVHQDSQRNSPNGYDAILSALDTSGNWNRQSSIEYLSKGLGSNNPGFSISAKDFNDAKPAIDLEDGKSTLATTMKQIASANGNLDGKGQERAVQWYNQAMSAWRANQAKGDKAMSATDFFDPEKKMLPPVIAPSRLQQIHNIAQTTVNQPAPPVLTDKKQFDELPSGTIYIRNGQKYRKP